MKEWTIFGLFAVACTSLLIVKGTVKLFKK